MWDGRTQKPTQILLVLLCPSLLLLQLLWLLLPRSFFHISLAEVLSLLLSFFSFPSPSSLVLLVLSYYYSSRDYKNYPPSLCCHGQQVQINLLEFIQARPTPERYFSVGRAVGTAGCLYGWPDRLCVDCYQEEKTYAPKPWIVHVEIQISNSFRASYICRRPGAASDSGDRISLGSSEFFLCLLPVPRRKP